MTKIRSLFTAWKKQDQDQLVMHWQRKTIGVLLFFCLLVSIGWMTAPSRLTVYIPPDISNGATLKAGEIPNPLIYAFAYEVWQEINYWPQDGSQDYPNNLHTYWSYLTPHFKALLQQGYAALKDNGQVQRQRFLLGMTGAAYESGNVKKLSSQSWEVDLTMRLMEYKNNQLVKDVEILYPLKITRMTASPHMNPYGLALAGFVREPMRLKTTL